MTPVVVYTARVHCVLKQNKEWQRSRFLGHFLSRQTADDTYKTFDTSSVLEKYWPGNDVTNWTFTLHVDEILVLKARHPTTGEDVYMDMSSFVITTQ